VKVAETRGRLREVLGERGRAARVHGADAVTLVPTMGALHEGHARLLEEAAARPGPLVVSIFVNPLQFGPDEDFETYPRSLDADMALCEDLGVDVVFAPTGAEMYPVGAPQVTIDPGPLGSILEGASRPGHFRGVLTVVAKLFGVVRPDVAIFGEKDYQQLVLLSRLVDDLDMPVEVVGAATVRDADGLALSSRNRYLSESERVSANALSRALVAGRAAGPAGGAAVLSAAESVLAAEPTVAADYLTLRAPDLSEPTAQGGAARLLVAARVGTTRLIDNMAVELGPEPAGSHAGTV
jgi:pantoate--beta-alanine ligase